MRNFLFGIILIGCGISSGCGKQDRLQAALDYSGKNRKELEKVLEHYSRNPSDSLKLQSAIFLIENMPGHYTYTGPFLDDYYARIDTIKGIPYHEKKLLQLIPFDRYEYRNRLHIQEDIKHIKADFLIHQIDLAFRQWQTLPWLEGTDFGNFKEYLLPYRIANEPLDYWRDSTAFFQAKLEDCIKNYEDCRYSVTEMKDIFYIYGANLRSKIPEEKLQNFNMDCIPVCKLNQFANRIIGLPSAIDFIPHYANRNGRHYWSAGIDPDINSFQILQTETYRAAKIYRRTFSHNPVPSPCNDEYIPPFFRDPFNKDVTPLYIPTTDIPVRIPRNLKIRHAYLAVFNDLSWKPIACAGVSGSKVRFRNMGKDIVYLPVYYEGEKMHPLAPPLIALSDGRIRHLDLYPDSVQTMTLKRKYPSNSSHAYWFGQLRDSRIETSDRADFKNAGSIFRFPAQITGTYNDIPSDTTHKKRYWRFITPSLRGADLADLRFYDQQGKEIQGRIIGADPTEVQALFDSSPLTYATIPHWVGMDFGHPVGISRIRYLPRNDANGIYPGNEYELLCYRFPEGWTSSGVQSPEGYELTYRQIPAGGLYWLRNLTCGREERIFTWENGKARFW